ncbi:MAG: glycosyltransferase family 2 protein, partial [Hyphomonadaceae bacterium]|nr:glycosyltransferase family 2 protein [Hyphomonadaceae bacterium]
TQSIQAELDVYPGESLLVTSPQNVGRSEARNRLLAQAETEWVLLLDADMLPDDHLFLVRYLDAVVRATAPGVVAGGFSLKRVRPGPQQKLHALQSVRSECLNAKQRARDPGRFVFTSNILVHRDVLGAVCFDEGFKGWGWEDVDWGLSVAQQFSVHHIDNTATHLGLDTDDALLSKYGGSAENFARLVARHPASVEKMALYRLARRLRLLGGLRPPLAKLCQHLAKTDWVPGRLRLYALKSYRALIYSGALK